MRVLVTGAGGQLGREVAEHCAAAGDDVVAVERDRLDVTDRDAVLAAVLGTEPDAVVHTAAWTAVDDCEADPDRALLVNAYAARHVAEACARTGAHLVHLSTDYVFSGDKAAAYHEWDEPEPRSSYGRSKLAGEQEVLRSAGPAGVTVVRTSWLSGRHGANMVKTLLRMAAGDAKPSFVDDQRGNPTVAGDLAPVLRRLALERRPGIFHVTNQGTVTWFELARQVFELAGADPDRVSPIRTAELDPPRPAPRPANSALDNAALRLAGIPLLADHRESIARLVRELSPA